MPDWLIAPVLYSMEQLFSQEPMLRDVLSPHTRLTGEECEGYYRAYDRKAYYYENKAALTDLMIEVIGETILPLANELIANPALSKGDEPLNFPLVFSLRNPAQAVQRIFDTFTDYRLAQRELFRGVAEQLRANLAGTSTNYKPVRPIDSTLPPAQLVTAYLSHTVFFPFFMAPVPLRIDREHRFNHTHIIGGTGAGKTTLIENLIVSDLQSANPPALVVVDPHGDLIKKLVRADLGVRERIIHIDPRDVRFPPALNVFAMNEKRLGGYSDAMREQVTASVIQTFDYLFTGLVGADLTAKQGVFFRYIARLMLTLPQTMGRNATIIDMMRLMVDPEPYREAVRRLPEIPREFFERDFQSKTFQQTKEQIRYRLQAIIENPTLARLFTSEETKIDLFSELNQGSIILLDTAKDFLKDGSSTFGRIFISLTLQAILERAAVPDHARRDTFLIVDEAASYFDSNIDDLLNEARKYRCGCVFAHQYLDQASSSLRASLAANAGIKFVSGVSAGDARSLASEMRTTPEFLMQQPKLSFATYVRGLTPTAVPVKVNFVENLPQLSITEYERFVENNRARTSFGAASGLAAPSAPAIPRRPDEDVSKEW